MSMTEGFDPGMEQWVEVLGLLSNVIDTSDELVAVFDGRLNKEIGHDSEKARAEIKRRIEAYVDARKQAKEYAEKIQAIWRDDTNESTTES